MVKLFKLRLFVLVPLCVSLLGCTPTATAILPTSIPDTSVPELTATPLPAPSPTPLPGFETVPLDTLGKSIPWLPLDKTARPGAVYFLFNLSKPPFTNVLVRQAFVTAIDRGALVSIALGHGVINPRPATTFTPPETLGRDLFNEVGISFHPSRARQLLAEAGYTDLSTFPPITLMTNRGPDDLNLKISEEMVRMWQIYLDIEVSLEIVQSGYFDRVKSDPTEIYFSIWAADYNDPDGFLLENFHTGSQYNYNNFSNTQFDELVDRAAASKDPATRQELYIQAERVLCETEMALIPIYHANYNIP